MITPYCAVGPDGTGRWLDNSDRSIDVRRDESMSLGRGVRSDSENWSARVSDVHVLHVGFIHLRGRWKPNPNAQKTGRRLDESASFKMFLWLWCIYVTGFDLLNRKSEKKSPICFWKFSILWFLKQLQSLAPLLLSLPKAACSNIPFDFWLYFQLYKIVLFL